MQRASWALAVMLVLSSAPAGAQMTITPEAQRKDLAKPRAGDEKGKALVMQYLGCLAKVAASLDDGISDAASVGIGVAASCQTPLHDYAVAVSKGNFDLQVGIEKGLIAKSHADATAAVLRHRRDRRAPPAPAASPKAKGEGI